MNQNNKFKSHYSQSRVYLGLCIILGVVCVFQPIIIIRLLQKSAQEQVIVMDAADNFHLVKSKPFKETKDLQIACVKFAVKSLFDRSPKGVDDPDGLAQAFVFKYCGDKVKEIIKKEQKEFEKKNINQDCEIGKINIIRQKKGRYLANITGQLIRACKYMDHSYIDVKLFRISLLLSKNKNISANGKMPLCVFKIIHYETKEKVKKQ
jgi:hypothetical protein